MRYILALTCALVGATCLLSGCGGGGGGVVATPDAVTATVPTTAYSLESFTLRIAGTGFGGPTSAVTVRLTAETGTPFTNGTAASIEVPGTVQGSGNVHALMPATYLASTTSVFVTVVTGSGSESASATPLLTIARQDVDAFGPLLVDGSRPVSFTITGTGFHPEMGTAAAIYLEAVTGAPFNAGPGPTSRISFFGTVMSDTEIVGSTSYAGVESDVPVRVRVRLPNGTEVLSSATLTTVNPGTVGVQGTWTYERVPSTTTGLDYSAIVERPMRGCRVQLVRSATNLVISSRTLDETGAYSIDYGTEEDVFLRVLAETGPTHPPIRIQDNTSGNALWSAQSPVFLITPTFQTKNFLAPCGWTGAGYGAPRASAPFAILDTVYEAASAFLAVRTFEFPLCILNWSPDNRPEQGSKAGGQIGGGAHYDGAELWLLGKEDVDTDEFDQPLIVHEWGHFFQGKLGRSDSIGGPHGFTDQLEPTVAFNEGIATALSAMILAPDTVYKDTYGPLQGTAGWLDIEDNSHDVVSGWFSESAVECIIYDLFDAASGEAWDTVSLGLGEMYDALVGPQVDTPYLTTIFSFIDALKSVTDSATDTAIDTLCQYHVITPVANAWGSTESNNGGWSANLPVYHLRAIGSSGYDLTLDSIYGWNQVEANRQLTVIGNGSPVTIQVQTYAPVAPANTWDHDILIEVVKNGVSIAWADDWDYGIETISLPSTVNGDVYIVRIGAIYNEDAVFFATVSVSSP